MITGGKTLMRRMVVVQGHAIRILVEVDGSHDQMRERNARLQDQLQRTDELALRIVLGLIVGNNSRQRWRWHWSHREVRKGERRQGQG